MKSSTAMYAPLIGRILLGGFFVWSGIQKVLEFPRFVSLFSNYGEYALYIALFLIFVETVFGLTLVIDFIPRFSAIILTIYLLATSFLFMHLNSATDTQLFLQNLAIVGGLLMTVGTGRNKRSMR